MTQVLLEQEKDFLLNYNHKKMYNQLLAEKQNGKKFSREDLTYDILFELSIIESTPDSLIADIFDMKKTQVRYLRQKKDLVNTLNIKMRNYPEFIYYMEKNNKRMEVISNYEYEKTMNTLIKTYYGNKSLNQNKKINHNNIIINVDGKELKYHVTFSDEKYIVNTKGKKRKGNGSHHNYKKENETKRLHGKIDEQIAFEAEKMRLIDIGLEYLIDDVQLVAQVSEEITFDGLGYDLISFNENKERIFIEVKTSFGNNDKPFFISAKEIELMQSFKKEHDCKYCLIYYVLIDDHNVTIKRIYQSDFSDLKLIPVLYRVE